MIRAGRTVVDRAAIAQLHGMTPATADRRKPWSAEGHPAPVHARRQLLWDTEQATAYAQGKPIAALPEQDAPGDLLDQYEAPAMLGLDPNSWRTGRSRGTFPEPDVTEHGVPFWRRDSVEAFDRFRKERGSYNPAGRPAGIAQRPRADAVTLQQQIRGILEQHKRAGTTARQIDIATKLGVHVNTVRNHMKAIQRADAAPASSTPSHD